MEVEVCRIGSVNRRARIPTPHRPVNKLDRQIMESMACDEDVVDLVDYDKTDFAEMGIEQLPKGVADHFR